MPETGRNKTERGHKEKGRREGQMEQTGLGRDRGRERGKEIRSLTARPVTVA